MAPNARRLGLSALVIQASMQRFVSGQISNTPAGPLLQEWGIEYPDWINWQQFGMSITTGYNASVPTIAFVAGVNFYGQTSLFVTTAYNGSVLPGPGQPTICQWDSINSGSAATVAFSQLSGVGNDGGCGVAWPAPLNVTVAWIPTTSTPKSQSLVAFGVMSQVSFFPPLWASFLFGYRLPPVVIDAQVFTALSASSGADGPGLLLLVYRGLLSPSRTDSTLITLSLQLADGDATAFVAPFIKISEEQVKPPQCSDPSLWPSPSQPDCTRWTWSFATGAGGGALYIDGADPCAPPTITGGGPPARVNNGTGSKDCSYYPLTDHLWLLIVPLGAPATAALPALGSTRAGSLQLFPQVQTGEAIN
jgi:hypothetical protein